MKILILANSCQGLYNFRQELIEELVKKGSVCVYTPINVSAEELEKRGCVVHDLPIDRRGINAVKDLKLLCKIFMVLIKEKPDLVITYTIKPNIYGGFACRLTHIPYAVNITGLGTAFQKKGLLRTIVTQMYKSGLKEVKVVFFENEENRQVFIDERIVLKDKTCLLMGAGVNLDRYQLADYPGGETIRFLFMGRVMKEKGINELFEAMHRLHMEGLNCSLNVLGEFEENYKDAIAKYEAEGWLNYYGHQNDVRPFIANCHCFVLPSWHEGMANTNLESAASGRPVITSNIHGCLEAVEDGVSGFLCEKQNAEDLYQVMKRFIELPYEERKNMGLAGRKRMEKVFDKKEVVERTMRTLDINDSDCVGVC